MQELLQLTYSELRSAWRFRWYAVVAAWSVGILGLGVVVSLPDIYEASTQIYIDATSELRPLLTDRIVPPDVATHLLYVRQALLGREYLERVAAENGLDAGVTSPADREELLERMRANVDIDVMPAGPGANAGASASSIFSIRFRERRPRVAVGVVRSLMNFLIEDTLGANRNETDMAARFLDERIAEYEGRLEQAEQALAQFQRVNSGRLPGVEGGYFERMQREQEALEESRRDLRLAESRRERLRQQLTSEAPLMSDDVGPNNEPRPNSIDARIRDQRADLDRMLLQFTERHPEVIALQESLNRLEEQRTEQLRALGISDADQQISALGANPVYQAVQISMNEVEVEVATLESDVRDRERRLQELQALIDEMPGVEAELARLNRDYDVIHDQYQAVIQSRETQQLSEQASAADQVDFRVLNPPSAESEPVAPPRLLLLGAVLLIALIAGAGLSYALAQLRPVFGSQKALREISGLPVIGTVSGFMDPHFAWRRRLMLLSFSASVISLVLMIGAVALFEVVGPGVRVWLGGA